MQARNTGGWEELLRYLTCKAHANAQLPFCRSRPQSFSPWVSRDKISCVLLRNEEAHVLRLRDPGFPPIESARRGLISGQGHTAWVSVPPALFPCGPSPNSGRYLPPDACSP